MVSILSIQHSIHMPTFKRSQGKKKMPEMQKKKGYRHDFWCSLWFLCEPNHTLRLFAPCSSKSILSSPAFLKKRINKICKKKIEEIYLHDWDIFLECCRLLWFLFCIASFHKISWKSLFRWDQKSRWSLTKMEWKVWFSFEGKFWSFEADCAVIVPPFFDIFSKSMDRIWKDVGIPLRVKIEIQKILWFFFKRKE